MKSILLLSVLVMFCSSIIANSFTITETSYKNSLITLYADIYIPQDPIPEKIGIALIQGSGNSDRNNLWSRSFAEFLAENGYYVLLPDKRGCGKSEGDWKNSSFQDLASDALSSIHHLKKKINLEKVGLMGLSQGGFIAPIAANQDNIVEFVIIVVGAAVTLEEQIIHEIVNTSRKMV